jgi:hypothetical protein
VAPRDSDSTTDPRPKHVITVRTRGRMHGLDCDIEFTTDVRKLSASVQYLQAQGFTAPPEPVVFSTTPDGKPICPKHRVPMREREKQGDRWHSHRVIAADGCELWCRGYSGPDSPGFDVADGLAVPELQPAGTVGHPLGVGAIARDKTAAASSTSTPRGHASGKAGQKARRHFGDGLD